MSRSLPASVILFVVGVVVATGSTSAAVKKKPVVTSDRELAIVERVLRAEVAGEIDRRAQLADAFSRQPDSVPARWQAGFVKDGDSWRSFDDPALSTAAAVFGEKYRLRRGEAPHTFQGQLDLANWCRKQGLFDRERAHLHAALDCGAGDLTLPIVERLGYCRIAGQWLSYEQLLEWRQLNRRAKESLKKWEARLTRLATRLSGSAAQRDAARENLAKTADSSAIPAIEYVFAGRSEDLALIAVTLLRDNNDHEATIALARQAVFSPWPSVRRSAGEALKGRRMEDFVPDLIGLLSTPIAAEVAFFELPEKPGVLYYNLVLARETDNQFQVSSLVTADHTLEGQVDHFNVTVSFFGFGDSNQPATMRIPDVSRPRFHHDWGRSISDRLEWREADVIRKNEQIASLNERISAVLAVVSAQDTRSTPQDWWKWWADYSDTQVPGAKRVDIVNEEETIGDPAPPPVSLRWDVQSCFRAGTPVWTEVGLVPIEKIVVGDRVLSKDVETGELEYKPVLRTTVRPPKELTNLRIGDETIVCTGGHRFWNSGSGWVKARDLAPQTLLHTATGNKPVWSARKGDSAETFNLVVADFHTYFVGKTAVLCQDLLMPARTNSVVPGLSRSKAAAAR